MSRVRKRRWQGRIGKVDAAVPVGAPHGGDRDGSTEHQVFAKLPVRSVVPALNEAKNLPHVLPRIPKGMREALAAFELPR